MNAHPPVSPLISRLSGAAAFLSLLACYGTLAVVGVLTLVGFDINIHKGAWAAVIVVFSWLALFGIVYRSLIARKYSDG